LLLVGKASAAIVLTAALFSAGTIIQGCRHQERAPLIAGIIGIACVGLHCVGSALSVLTVSPWLSLIGAGVILLVVGSIYESNAVAVQNGYRRHKNNLSRWS